MIAFFARFFGNCRATSASAVIRFSPKDFLRGNGFKWYRSLLGVNGFGAR